MTIEIVAEIAPEIYRRLISSLDIGWRLLTPDERQRYMEATRVALVLYEHYRRLDARPDKTKARKRKKDKR